MDLKRKVSLSLLILTLGVGIGKYTLPAKVVTKTETVVVEKEVIKYKESSNENTKSNTIKITNEFFEKDGTIRRETIEIDKTEYAKYVDKQVDKEIDKKTDTKTESSTQSQATWHIAGITTLKIREKPEYGFLVEKQIAGPISAGVVGMTNGTVGLTLGYSF